MGFCLFYKYGVTFLAKIVYLYRQGRDTDSNYSDIFMKPLCVT